MENEFALKVILSLSLRSVTANSCETHDEILVDGSSRMISMIHVASLEFTDTRYKITSLLVCFEVYVVADDG